MKRLIIVTLRVGVGIGIGVAIAISIVSVLFDIDSDCDPDSDADPDGSLFAVIFGTESRKIVPQFNLVPRAIMRHGPIEFVCSEIRHLALVVIIDGRQDHACVDSR